MKDLSKYPGLFSRGGVWYVRKTVPKELQHLRKSNFKTSLGVPDVATAKKLYHQAMLEIQGKIESLCQEELKSTEKKEGFDALSKEQVIALAYSWYNAYKSKLDILKVRFAINGASETGCSISHNFQLSRLKSELFSVSHIKHSLFPILE